MTTETQSPPAANAADPHADKRRKIAELDAEISTQSTALAELRNVPGGTEIAVYKIMETMYEDNVKRRDSLVESIARADKLESLKKYNDPIIANFGVVTVESTKGIPTTVDVLNLEKMFNDAAELISRGKSIQTIVRSLQKAVERAKVPEDATEDLRPFQILTEGEKSVKIAVATRSGRGTGTGTRSGRGQLVKIVSANDPSLVGRTVGKDGDYANWKDFLETTDPQLFADLEEKRNNGSNYSAPLKARQKLGVEFVPADADLTPTGETAAA